MSETLRNSVMVVGSVSLQSCSLQSVTCSANIGAVGPHHFFREQRASRLVVWRFSSTGGPLQKTRCISGFLIFSVLKSPLLCWHKPSVHSFSSRFVTVETVLSTCMANSVI